MEQSKSRLIQLTYYKTLKRKLFGEVGVKVKDNLIYVRNTPFEKENVYKVNDIVFLCEFDNDEPYIKSPDEGSKGLLDDNRGDI